MSGPALYDRFLRGLASGPRRPAIRIGDRTMSYEELHEYALCYTGMLLHRCTDPPTAVGVLAGKGFAAYTAVLAALYTGASVVPLHPGFPVARTRHMLDAAGVSAVLADPEGLASLVGLSGLNVPVLAVEPDGGRGLLGGRGSTGLAGPRAVHGSDVAYVLFTSGSTGTPKAVPIRHDSVHHYFRLVDERYDFAEDDVFSQTFDLNFDCAMFDMFGAWGVGASIQPVPVPAYRDMPAFLTDRRVTVWFSVPTSIGLIRRMGGMVPGSLPTLRWSLFAGEALRGSDAADWQRAAAHSIVENLYGPTELTITVTAHRWYPESSPARCVNGLVPIGAVHDGHDHLLLDDAGRPAETEGELCVTGPQMTAGYLDPADNRDRFLRHDGRLWYRTGDRVRRLSGGELAYLGRRDGQVQVRGWRVELAEVDHAVRSCTGVTDAVTVACSTARGLELVVFYTGARLAPAELTRQLRRNVPAGALPSEYVHVDGFPLNANGKVDRAALAARASGG